MAASISLRKEMESPFARWKSALLAFVFLFTTCRCDIDNCTFKTKDLSLLKKYNPWKLMSSDGKKDYQINICDSMKPFSAPRQCHSDTAVCMSVNDEQPVSIGNLTTLSLAENVHAEEITLIMAGDKCESSHHDVNNTVMITFSCGTDLGVPEYVGELPCTTIIEWRTNLMCTDVALPRHQVPCYAYDDHGHRHDLSPLIKHSGAYYVEAMSEAMEFYINPCQDIFDSSLKCSNGSAACHKVGSRFIDAGQALQRVTMGTGGQLMLQYTTTVAPEGCNINASTVIEFRCPEFGGSKDPRLVNNVACQYHVEWETEHACKEVDISNTTCRLVREEDNIDIDLSVMSRKSGDSKYSTRFGTGKDNYTYFINICGDVGIQCPDDSNIYGVAACQTKENDASFGKIMGKTSKSKLRFADGLMTLTYMDGDFCHTGARRSTVINFECDPNAKNNGRGEPEFEEEVDKYCIYVFNWKTKYACLGHPANEECVVAYKGRHYDLSALVRREGDNWEVIDPDQSRRYFINVCNDVLQNGTTTQCPDRSAVCLMDEKKNFHNVGSYVQNPVFDPNVNGIKIEYSLGEQCATDRYKKSRISFFCKPGDLDSGPVFLDKSVDGCEYNFEWYTAAACPLGRANGTNCMVVDTVAGFNFDLSPLKSTTYYNVSDDAHVYDYLINVCGEAKGTPCSGSVASCQVKKNNQQAISTGQPSTALRYFDGMINLTYTNGQPYHGTPVVNRQTEITFLCDHNAGIGKPTFTEESNHAYSFEWFTLYACPVSPVECTVSHQGKEYDLSSLTKSGNENNWELQDTPIPGKKVKYYINICQPLTQVPVVTACGPFASVCRTNVVGDIEVADPEGFDLGSVVSKPAIDDDGTLKLVYKTKTKTCKREDNTTDFSTTIIKFYCEHGSMNKGPSRIEILGKCSFLLLWQTEAACALEDVKTQTNSSLKVKDKNLDYVYDLSSLTLTGTNSKSFYSVGKYRLNIGGPVPESSCSRTGGQLSSLCEVSGNGQTTGLMPAGTFTLENSEDGKLLYTQDGNRDSSGRRKRLQIVFICKKGTRMSHPTLALNDSLIIMFNIETVLACKQEPIECSVTAPNGDKYDLSPLARGEEENNWMVLDRRDTTQSNVQYYINICRPVIVDKIPGGKCKDGPIGGCQVSGEHSYNIGYVVNPPSLVNGMLTMEYTGGDICDNGIARKTKIEFVCGPTEENPIFVEETGTCEFVFNWITPQACPLKNAVFGDNCAVTEPLYSHVFDLSALRVSKDYEVTGVIGSDTYKFVLNVCGELQHSECGEGAAACQMKPSDSTFSRLAGRPSSRLEYSSSIISLTYDYGQPCHDAKFNRSSILNFICDETDDGKGGPKFISESSDCTYAFEWKTSLACTPVAADGCSVRDDNTGNQYDLSDLSLSNDNYDYIDRVNKKKYILNVCKSLVHLKGEACPYDSAVCQIDLNQTEETLKYHNWGSVNANQVTFSDGKLQLRYTNGEECGNGKKASTVIEMICSEEDLEETPRHISDIDCVHYFQWINRYACPQQTAVVGTDCTVKNPMTDYVYDLNSLRSSSGYQVDDRKGHLFKMNVCGKVSGSSCADDAVAVCQEEQINTHRNYTAGLVTGAVLEYISKGYLTLTFKNGDDCHDHKFNRSVIIEFICSPESKKGQPVFIEEKDDCTYYFTWHTDTVCEEQIKCAVDVGLRTIDLSPLIQKSEHYLAIPLATDTKAAYYINVCRPLNPIQNIHCPPDAAACMIGNDESVLSLGTLSGSPKVEQGLAVLVYENGSRCPSDKSKNLSSKIIFQCKIGVSVGTPVLKEINSCQYVFVWETYVVCSEDVSSLVSKDCSFTDPQTKAVYDFSPLQKISQTLIRNKYKVGVCELAEATVTTGCAGAAVCEIENKTGISWGQVDKGVMTRTGHTFSLTYSDGNKCSGYQKRNSTIVFDCDEHGSLGNPTFSSEIAATCLTTFMWRTCLTCARVADACAVGYGSHSFDLTMLSSEKGSWSTSDNDGNRYWINICQAVHGGPKTVSDCPDTVGAWRQKKNGQVDSLGLVGKQSIHTTDGKTIVLEYKNGDYACAHERRRNEDVQAWFRIKFTCGATVGKPVFERLDSVNCLFEFSWKSKVACQISREEVSEKDGIIVDPETGNQIDFNNFKPVALQPYSLDVNGKAKGCEQSSGVVCLKTDSNYQVLGTFNSRKFYIEDGKLEMVVTSSIKCENDPSKFVGAIISFECSDIQEVKFASKSRDCIYMFEWRTPQCLSDKVVVPQSGEDDNKHSISNTNTNNAGQTSASAGHGSTIGIVVLVFALAIGACILVIVFHKKERRTAFVSRVRGIFGKKDDQRYSIIPDLDPGDGEEIEGFDELLNAANIVDYSTNTDNNTLTDDETLDISVQPPKDKTKSYHDDSDEDMLL